MGRRAALASVTAAIAISGGVVSGCGNSGQGLAQQACTHVDRSITLYQQAERTTDRAAAAARINAAYVQLRQALPLAAAATSANGQWNALMTAISESARVQEGQLLVALRDECSAARSNQSNAPFAPAPPAPTGPVPSSPTPTRAQQGY